MSPRYAVESETRGSVEIFTLREGDRAYASIAPEWGNNCFALCAPEPIIEPVSFEDLRQRPTGYGVPILFPFPNRVRDGECTFGGRRYTVVPNRHGFVRNRPWDFVAVGASDNEGAWITSRFDSTRYPEEILQQFPFPFLLDVTHRLLQGTLEILATLQNAGDGEMPCGFGLHPYFRLPERGTIQVPARKRWRLEDSLPTGELLMAEGKYDLRGPRDLAGVILDDIFTDLIPDSAGRVHCVLEDRQKGTRAIVEFEAHDFPHVTVYTPAAPRRAVCIEPYTCPTDAFNLHQRGIDSQVIFLRPGEVRNLKVSIRWTAAGERG